MTTSAALCVFTAGMLFTGCRSLDPDRSAGSVPSAASAVPSAGDPLAGMPSVRFGRKRLGQGTKMTGLRVTRLTDIGASARGPVDSRRGETDYYEDPLDHGTARTRTFVQIGSASEKQSVVFQKSTDLLESGKEALNRVAGGGFDCTRSESGLVVDNAILQRVDDTVRAFMAPECADLLGSLSIPADHPVRLGEAFQGPTGVELFKSPFAALTPNHRRLRDMLGLSTVAASRYVLTRIAPVAGRQAATFELRLRLVPRPPDPPLDLNGSMTIDVETSRISGGTLRIPLSAVGPDEKRGPGLIVEYAVTFERVM